MMFDAFIGPSSRRLRHYILGLKPDIIHFHETWGLASQSYSIPTVFTIHGFDSLNLLTERPGGWRWRSWLWHLPESWGLKKQRHLIAIAPYVRKEIEKLTSARIYDIWNTLDRRFFELTREESAGRILFLGWINPRKNPLVLVEVAARLKERIPHLRIDLCGEISNPEYCESLKQRIAELGVVEQVHLVGRLPQSEVMCYLQKASLLVLPSLQENAPMVVAEAMAAGVPVIASDLCGIPDMIEQDITGYLVKPNDVAGIAEKVTLLMEDDNLRQEMGRRARVTAYKRFHPESVAKATLAVYKEAIASFSG